LFSEMSADMWTMGRFAVTRTRYPERGRTRVCAGVAAELFVIARGTVAVQFGRQRHVLHGGCAMLIGPRTRFTMHALSDAVCLRVRLHDDFHAPAEPVLETTARAWAISLIEEIATRDPGWQLAAEGYVLVGLGRLQRVHTLVATRPSWLDGVIELARRQQPLSEIAKQVGRHPSHVAREFRRHEGVSVGEYARRCRLELAGAILRDGNEAIADVALNAGFCDQSHFTNAFHRVFGVTPAEFRRAGRAARD
jgi:AraC-like DNA-binding protein